MTILDQFSQTKKEATAVGLELNKWCKVLIKIRLGEVEKRLMDSDMSVEETEASWWMQYAD